MGYAASWGMLPPCGVLINSTCQTPRKKCRDIQHAVSCRATVPQEVRLSLALETLKTRQRVPKAAMMYKVTGGQADVSQTCSTLTPTTQKSTRGLQMKLSVPHFSITRYTSTPSFAITLWNFIPLDVLHAESTQAFKKKTLSSKTGRG